MPRPLLDPFGRPFWTPPNPPRAQSLTTITDQPTLQPNETRHSAHPSCPRTDAHPTWDCPLWGRCDATKQEP